MKKFITGAITALSIMTISSIPAEAQRENPLLQPYNTPHATIPFDKIQPSDYDEAFTKALELQKEEINAIVKQRSIPDFENTIAALDRSGSKITEMMLLLGNLEHATGDTVLMNLAAKWTPIVAAQSTEIMLNEPLWERVKQVYDNRGNFTHLTKEEQTLLNETYLSFVESGANLKGKDRKRYSDLEQELADLTLKFAQNVTNELSNPEKRLWLTADQLSGLPENIKIAAREEAKEILESEGKTDDGTLYVFTMFAPSYSPFLKYQDDRALREKLYRMYATRNIGGPYDNVQLMKDIANVRLEIANLMGKDNFAQYKLQRTMAQTPEGVYGLLNHLKEAYKEPAMKEVAEIEAFAQKTQGPDFKLQPWDYSYWADKLKNDQYAFNDEDMKPYFEINNTIKGVFGLATKLYGFTFKENKNIPVYHPDVLAYEVYDKKGKLMGILYADFYYRAGKAPGAWMTEFNREQISDEGVKTLPHISIVCNFSKPVGNEPVLLTPYEVETFLHEFGHSLHGLSADTKYASLSGTNVYHDFVETFSQFNENYMTEKEFLDSFAKHYKTGKKMPQELIDKFLSAQQFGAAYACMRQLGFGVTDMAFYTIENPLRATTDIEAFENAALKDVAMFPAVEGVYFSPSFAHVFSGGYSAGYYGYKWAEMLDADAFEAFKENGIFDKKTAEKFLKMMSAGGTVPPMELYLEFRGHEPTLDALMRRDGIIK